MSFADTGLSIDMNFEGIEGLIGNRGTCVIHELSLVCPCMQTSPEDGFVGVADPACVRCMGLGYLYRDPRFITGLVTGIRLNKLILEQGWAAPGDLTLAPSTHARRVSDYDRVTLRNSIPVDSEVKVRGVVTALTPRPSVLAANEDMLWWEAGEREATWIEDEDGREYRAGEYRLSGRRIIWTPGAGPAIGKSYTVKYEAFQEYIAWTTPMERLDRGRRLGQQVMLRKRVIDSAAAQRQITLPKVDDLVYENAFRGDRPYNDRAGEGGKPTSDPPR